MPSIGPDFAFPIDQIANGTDPVSLAKAAQAGQAMREINALANYDPNSAQSQTNALGALVRGGQPDQAAALSNLNIARQKFALGQQFLSQELANKNGGQSSQPQAQAPTGPDPDAMAQSLSDLKNVPLDQRGPAFIAAAQSHGLDPGKAFAALGGDLSDGNLAKHSQRLSQASQQPSISFGDDDPVVGSSSSGGPQAAATAPAPVSPDQSTYAQAKAQALGGLSDQEQIRRAGIKAYTGIDLDPLTDVDKTLIKPELDAQTDRAKYNVMPQEVELQADFGNLKRGQKLRFDTGAQADAASLQHPGIFGSPSAAEVAGDTEVAKNAVTPTSVPLRKGGGSQQFASVADAQAAIAANPDKYGEQDTLSKASDSAQGSAKYDPATYTTTAPDGTIQDVRTNRAALSQAGSGGTLVMNDPAKNNNPYNLRPLSKGKWSGQVDVTPGNFAVFDSQASASRAADQNLQSYFNKGVNTPAAIATRWNGAPSASYTQAIAVSTGIPGGQPIPNTPAMRAAILQGVKVAEGTANGGGKGVVRVGGGVPVMAPTSGQLATAAATASARAAPITAAGTAAAAPILAGGDQTAADIKDYTDNIHNVYTKPTFKQDADNAQAAGAIITGLASNPTSRAIAMASQQLAKYGVSIGQGAAASQANLAGALSSQAAAAIRGAGIKSQTEFHAATSALDPNNPQESVRLQGAKIGASGWYQSQLQSAEANYYAGKAPASYYGAGGAKTSAGFEAYSSKAVPSFFAAPQFKNVTVNGQPYVENKTVNGKSYMVIGAGLGRGNAKFIQQ